MKKEQVLNPKLRFPKFELMWKQVRLENVFEEFRSGNGITSQQISEVGEYPVYGGNGLRGYTDSFTHSGEYLLVGRQGALCGNIKLVNGHNYISEHAIAGQANGENSTKWLAYKLDYMNLNKLSESSAQPGLSVNKLLRLKLVVPSLPEQQKIASFLSSVDERIELLERKKEKLEAYKKGVMQQLFSQQIRFKQDDGSDFPDWEEKRLGEVAKVFSGGTPKSSDPNLYGGEIPFIRSGEINASSTELTLTEKGLKTSSAKMVAVGDLLLAIYGATSGEAGISKISGAINQAVLCIRWGGENLFLLNWLKLNKTALTQKYLQGGQGNLSGEIVKSFELNLPCLEEQRKIASFLGALDENLETLNSQIQGLRTWKNGLLQQMFL
ncbi:MAG: restriction endonuclease subunit S [Cecembia sp.]